MYDPEWVYWLADRSLNLYISFLTFTGPVVGRLVFRQKYESSKPSLFSFAGPALLLRRSDGCLPPARPLSLQRHHRDEMSNLTNSEEKEKLFII